MIDLRTKICRDCNTEKLVALDFYKNRSGVQSYCKLCMCVRFNEYHRRLRLEVLAAYGSVCHCCGESILEFLSLDHINRDGKKDGKRGRNWYLRLKREGFPNKEQYRVSCHNCNMGREANRGVCPHVRNSNTNKLESNDCQS
jgi:hypothetical protein